jgi:hypothetical protein
VTCRVAVASNAATTIASSCVTFGHWKHVEGGAEPSSHQYSCLKDNYHSWRKHCLGSLFASKKCSVIVKKFRPAEAVDQELLTRVALLSISCF